MLEIKNIYKSFGNLEVLKNISFTIGKREIVAIVGPSGAGKTTLLQIAGTLEKPDSGSLLFNGTELIGMKDKKLSAFRNKNIGFVFQFHQLLPEFTAQENVALPAMIAGMSRKKALDKAAELLTQLGLSGRMDHKPAAMSGGERQRTAIARALVNDPEIIFADEPTGSLDSANREEIQNIFTDLRDRFGQTVVMVTHDSSLAGIADSIIEMEDGRIKTPAPEQVSEKNIISSDCDESFPIVDPLDSGRNRSEDLVGDGIKEIRETVD
ncbi:MAG: ABC transporter ATP-binding protein [Muribaculaceae bacterium]|nr:ABC transporter ATP-binding protein [Muribaculaceae bacterium]